MEKKAVQIHFIITMCHFEHVVIIVIISNEWQCVNIEMFWSQFGFDLVINLILELALKHGHVLIIESH